MILQALYDYSRRREGLAPEGFEWKEIPFVCRLDQHGRFIKFDDTREKINEKDRAKQFLVPSLGEAKGSGIKSNLLWENAEYVFGVLVKDSSKEERVKIQAQAFRDKIRAAFGPSLESPWSELMVFLEKIPLEQLQADPLWKEIIKPGALIVFAIDGIGILTDHFDAIPRPQEENDYGEGEAFCLITGEKSFITRLLPQIRGIRGANSTGASLVAVNNKVENGRNQGETPAFGSYLKQQGFNSPISSSGANGFAKALNSLLGRDSKNKVQVGDATTVFWSDKKTSFEDDFFSFWSVTKDDPDRGIRAVETLLRSPHTGSGIPDGDTRFFVLGLSPNAARASVRFWHTGTVAEFSNRIRQHFQDLDIVKPKNDKGSYALFFLLSDIATENKAENIPPNLAGNVMRSILTGGLYPMTLLQQAVRRIRANREVKRTQAAVLKAYLNRQHRFQSNPTEEEITVALDLANNNSGYRLGRLFAALEKIQEDAQPGINATIRDRYYGAASSSPITVFPQLLKLKNHHLAKLENPAFRVVHEKRLTEIFGGLSPDMPGHLSMEDQARFAVGYYHQRQAFFTKSDKSE